MALNINREMALNINRKKELEYIVRETLWMARRYAHNRRTFAASTVNECIDIALKLGINIEYDEAENTMYADDGDLGKWNPDLQRFERE